MKGHFYGKLALGNLQKNSRFYLPYIFTQAGLLACFYIILTLCMDDRLHDVKGGSYISTFMLLGVVVMLILSTILLLYMNSFLMKQRGHEYGLYNILGMEKKHVCRILFYESLYANGAAIGLGLVSGIVFYKLCSLLICRLLKVNSVLGFYYIRPISLLPSVGFFLLLDLFLYFFNRIRIQLMKPVELLQSQKAGEKEPKTNWFLFLPGLLALGYGYYLALTTQNPLQAINTFFPAVLAVILGTYLLFTAGSILILRMLKANKGYYYRPKHMISVSGLLYRMRQNAVGLASITILACGVLVMLSTTISLYAGTEDSLAQNFHNQLVISANYDTEEQRDQELTEEEICSILEETGARYDLTLQDCHEERYLEVTYLLGDDKLKLVQPSLEDSANIACITYLTADEYEKMVGQKLTLAEDEIAICSFDIKHVYPYSKLQIGEKQYRVAKELDIFPLASSYNLNIVSCYGIVLPSEEDLDTIYQAQHAFYEFPSEYIHRFAANYKEKISYQEGTDLMEDILENTHLYMAGKPGATGSTGLSSDSIWDAAVNLYGMYGSLFFLGLILGFVFLFATALILYYKQISEGYEDRERFQIMAKIGLSDAEAQKAISGQLLLVFFLPLLVSGLHLAVAFPLLEKMLRILQLGNLSLFVKCTLLAYVGFAIIYTGIYKMTAKIYYRIVS